MQFVFDEPKAAQAAALLLEWGGGEMDRMKLIKLMYLADRRAWIETGVTITGDQMVSMPHGPVLSKVYNRIRGDHPVASATMKRFVLPGTGYKVRVASPHPELGRLSKYDLRVLREIHAQFGGWSTPALRRYTHKLPEYQDPSGSMVPIDPTVILKSEGQSEEQIAWRVQQAAELVEIDKRHQSIGA